MIEYRRLKHFGGVALIGALAALLPATASAGVIFTNFGAGLAYDVTQGNPVGNDFVGDNAAEGDSFIPTSNAVFGSALLALSCAANCVPENFTISLMADNADSPGAAIESFNFVGFSLGALGNNNAPVKVTSVLQPTLLAATRYWFTVSSSLNFAIVWNNNTTGDTNDQAVSSDGGATWFAPSGMTPGALEVDSPAVGTPEPSAGLLAGAGLMAVWWLKRRAVRTA
jgi:hypothetical protein